MDMNMRTFDELQRHQLMTEFNVQSQSELTDYQVKLDNVSNPTQAQDNLIVGINGESLPHWNESVDFDTWVKMNVGGSGKRGLLIHGNDGLSSWSSIEDTMRFGDDFGDSSIAGKWTDDITCTESGGLLHVVGSTGAIYGDVSVGINHIFGVKARTNDLVGNGYVGWGEAVDYVMYFNGDSNLLYSRADNAYKQNQALTTSMVVVEIARDGTNIHFTIDGITNSFASTTTQSKEARIYLLGDATDIDVDYIYFRKYATTEPTVQIGTPKNISTALKSFGRAG